MTEKDVREKVLEVAVKLWVSMSDKQRAIVKFGMTPAELLEAPEVVEVRGMLERGGHGRSFHRLFAVSLKDCAGDGMVV